MEIPNFQSTSQRTNEYALEVFALELWQAPNNQPFKETAEPHQQLNQCRQPAITENVSGAYSSTLVDFSKLSSTLEKNFKRIDKDRDGFLTYKELSEAVQDPSLRGKDALALAVLKSGQTEILDNCISILVNDSDPHKGISLKDAEAYFGLLGMAQQANCSVGNLYSNMSRAFAKNEFQEQLFPKNLNLDASKVSSIDPWMAASYKALSLPKKNISESSLVAASRSDKFNNLEKSVIYSMLHNREFLCSLEPDDKDPSSISVFDLRKFATMAETASLFERQTWRMILRRDTNPNPSSLLFAKQDKPIESIRPAAVRQGDIGDCYFLAAVGTVAAHNPELLSKMITTTESGGYKVKFPGAKGIEVIVGVPTETELLLYANATEYGTWVAILEKAYAKLLAENPEHRPPVYSSGAYPPENIGLGGLHEGFEMLTGSTPELFKIESSPRQIEALRQRLVLGKKNAEMAMAASKMDECVKPDVVPGHAYTVLDYDEKSVTLRNPWGVTRVDTKEGLPFVIGADTGVSRMSLEDFSQKFEYLFLTPRAKPTTNR